MVDEYPLRIPTGVLVALVTPLDESGELDVTALDRLLERALGAGVVGVSPNGSIGEGPRQNRDQRLRMITAVRDRVPDGFPVIPAVPVNAVDEAIEELHAVGLHGATAAMVAPPSYYPAGEADMERLYLTLAERSPVPLVLYNIPAMTKTQITPAVVASLARHPRVIAMKDSSRDLEYLQAAVYAVEDAEFQILTGSDTLLLPSVLAGATGTIAASANLVPALGVALYSAAVDGRLDVARGLQRQLFAVVQACRRGSPPAGWKAALEIAGLCSARMLPPAGRLADHDYRALSDDLERLLPVSV